MLVLFMSERMLCTSLTVNTSMLNFSFGITVFSEGHCFPLCAKVSRHLNMFVFIIWRLVYFRYLAF